MTLADCVNVLRELRGLARLDASITRLLQNQATAPEWRYALTAIADRRKWLDYGVSVTDPQILAQADAVLQAEPVAGFSAEDWTTAWKDPH